MLGRDTPRHRPAKARLHRQGRRAGFCAVLVALGVASIAHGEGLASTEGGCASPTPADEQQLMDAYARAGSFPARQVDWGAGLPAMVSVEIPPIQFTGPGRSSTLPIGPCQHIYRFRYPEVRGHGQPLPFRYVEVDWNTEGEPRGPNGSFLSPHFDFHFYSRPRAYVHHATHCISTNGRTCDATLTSPEQMRRFLRIPRARYFPSSYRPDLGSSIPSMGLHLLDQRYRYTVPYVDHHPVLIYGTFDDRVLFAEASVTLATLEDARNADSGTVGVRFRAPAAVANGLPWPTRFQIRFLPATETFRAEFTKFRKFPR
jgi:hypothetical protein